MCGEVGSGGLAASPGLQRAPTIVVRYFLGDSVVAPALAEGAGYIPADMVCEPGWVVGRTPLEQGTLVFRKVFLRRRSLNRNPTSLPGVLFRTLPFRVLSQTSWR